MTDMHILWIVIAMAAGTAITRFLPFFLFPQGKEMPRYVEYLAVRFPMPRWGFLWFTA